MQPPALRADPPGEDGELALHIRGGVLRGVRSGVPGHSILPIQKL
jgi:hypothetical protein